MHTTHKNAPNYVAREPSPEDILPLCSALYTCSWIIPRKCGYRFREVDQLLRKKFFGQSGRRNSERISWAKLTGEKILLLPHNVVGRYGIAPADSMLQYWCWRHRIIKKTSLHPSCGIPLRYPHCPSSIFVSYCDCGFPRATRKVFEGRALVRRDIILVMNHNRVLFSHYVNILSPSRKLRRTLPKAPATPTITTSPNLSNMKPGLTYSCQGCCATPGCSQAHNLGHSKECLPAQHNFTAQHNFVAYHRSSVAQHNFVAQHNLMAQHNVVIWHNFKCYSEPQSFVEPSVNKGV